MRRITCGLAIRADRFRESRFVNHLNGPHEPGTSRGAALKVNSSALNVFLTQGDFQKFVLLAPQKRNLEQPIFPR